MATADAVEIVEPARSPARRAARARIYELIRTAQLGDDRLGTELVTEIIDDAEARGWPDVVKLGMFLGIFCDRYVYKGSGAGWSDALLRRAEQDGDAVMTALALASRAQDLGSRAPIDADRDLARATVLLESWTGPSIEAVSAHIECAYAYEQRDLWELQLRHYENAEACVDWDEGGAQRQEVLLCNYAEAQMFWLAALRERGRCSELAVRARLAREALRRADLPTLPAAWREALHIWGELVDAIAPPAAMPASAAPAAMNGAVARTADGEYAGYTHLARALIDDDPHVAQRHCERAIEALVPMGSNRVDRLARSVSVELESTIAGHETAGERWTRTLTELAWEKRMATLSTIESLISVQRRETECARLREHAHLDDLTGLANRRGLMQFTDELLANGTQHAAVALLDLDRFKSINDVHGHPVGDAVLTRVATILRDSVRSDDLVVRLGGDEFLIVLLIPDLDAAHRRGQAIAASVAADAWAVVSEGLEVTASVGVAHGSLAQLEELMARADAALYRAKRSGRAQART